MKTYKPYLISVVVILVALVLFYFLGEIVLPFFVGLFLAYLINPIVCKIQKVIKNRNLAVTAALLIGLISVVGTAFIFGSEIIRDTKRFNDAILVFADENQEEIDEGSREIKSFIQGIYNSDMVQERIQVDSTEKDSLLAGGIQEAKTALSGMTSFLGSSESNPDESDWSINWLFVLFSSMAYFLYIIYTYSYFKEKFDRYFDEGFKSKKGIQQFIDDFKRIFLAYFRKRTLVVLCSGGIFLLSFLILDVPGAIILALVAALLCYIPHFHYVTLIPLSLSCWVLSMENNHSFFLYFGILIGVFILVSVLEEIVFTPKIMREYTGMNPAIMLVSFAVWSHIFGPTIGTLVALPLTTVALIYLDRLLLFMKQNMTEK